MLPYSKMSQSELTEQLNSLLKEFNEYKGMNLKLSMARGNPSEQQLNLGLEMLGNINDEQECVSEDGIDCRNYGEVTGIHEMKEIFSEMIDIDAQNIILYGNSSLNAMFDTFSRAFAVGLAQSDKPWCKYDNIKILCPTPGYDRHFAIGEYFGFELIGVPMTPDGPDMDMVEKLVKDDDSVKAIWCVPIYSNPDGYVYSAETVRRLAGMKCAAKDFTIMYDLAYCVYNFYGETVSIPNMVDECAKAGNPDRAVVFASTSKITFAGGGVSCIAGSRGVIDNCLKTMRIQTIGFDKINQLRHAKYLKNLDNIRAIISKHADILRPKFEFVLNSLNKSLGGLEIAEWTKPRGGYFISLYVSDGTAKRVHELCEYLGVMLTPAGAGFPYGIDPNDRHLRLAPSFPTLEDLHTACKVLCLSVKIASIEKLLGQRLPISVD